MIGKASIRSKITKLQMSDVRLRRMRSRKLVSALVLSTLFTLALSAQSIWKESKNPSWKTATGAEQYERLMWQAIQKKDWLAVESHMASNFVYTDANGTEDKAQHVANLKLMTAPDAQMGAVNVTPSGNHAIVTYSLGGNRYMAVWQQQKSGWVQVAVAVVPTSK